ncbi:MAG: response regulator [Sedimentisphaerales bacterium]
MKVLIAEDDTASRIILEKHLKDWGYEVLSAQNGSEAWQIIQNQQPEIVLIDWMMPAMDGLELCKRIRSAQSRKYTFIIFLTSKVENEDVVTALDTGADDYLCKPFDKKVLKSRMAVGARTINYENELQKSEERYQRITNSITDYIFTIKISAGRITEILHSDSSIAVTGYSAQELNENPSLWLEIVHKDDKQRVSQQLNRCAMGEAAESVEYRIIRKDGALRWVKSTVVQQLNKNDSQVSYDCLLKDITEMKNAEEQMRIAKEKAQESQVRLEKLNLQLEITYKKLMETSHSAGMAEVAANVLHNVGNALNSINVSAAIVTEKITNSEISNLTKLAELLGEHIADLAEFLTNDPQGKYIPIYLAEVSSHLAQQQAETVEKLRSLMKNVEHVKSIVQMQQLYAGTGAQRDSVLLNELIENAVEINNAGLERYNIEIVREYDDIGSILIDRQRTLQILVNLIDNAEHSLSKSDREPKLLRIRTAKTDDSKVRIEIIDNGIGINPADLNAIFENGYTTKQAGHGFGLHSCLLAARDMQATLTAKSGGQNQGATFILELPLKKAESKPPHQYPGIRGNS